MVYSGENNYSRINALQMAVELRQNQAHTAGMTPEEFEKKIAEGIVTEDTPEHTKVQIKLSPEEANDLFRGSGSWSGWLAHNG